MKILIVISQYNKNITSALENDVEHFIKELQDVSYDILHVPGAFEIPGAIAMAIDSNKKYDGYIALGCIIRGSTSHYEIISNEVAKSLSRMIIEHKTPIGYGVMNTENLEQAMERIGIGSKNNYAKGAVDAVIAMIKIKSQFSKNG